MSDQQIIEKLKVFAKRNGATVFETESFEKAIRMENYHFVLECSENKLHYLRINNYSGPEPSILCELQSLFMLDLYNYSSEISWLSKLYSLRCLFIKDTPNDIFIHDLSTLSLRSVVFHTSIPDAFFQVKSIEEIRFSSPIDTVELPEWIGELPKLKKVDLTNCTVKSIPYNLAAIGLDFVFDCDNGRDGVKLFGTRLLEGDISLFQQPRDVILAYYKGQKVTNLECKVIFLGDGESGKSSLIDRIIHDSFDENKTPTEGIRINAWPVNINGDKVLLRILDFGGQEIMHAMHRCFLTNKTVYVVVCESRNDSDIDATAARWLENIRTFAPDCPVILALNKADLNQHVSVNQRDLEKVNNKLCAVLETSAKWEKVKGTYPLINVIKRETSEIVKGMTFNKDMLGLKQALEGMKKPYISDTEYRQLCEKHGIRDEKLQNELLEWFKTLGVSYYYTSRKVDTRLEGLRVLTPAWLTNGMYRLILRTPSDGILPHKTIKQTLKAYDPADIIPEIVYTPEETDYILHVMRNFEISHDIGDGREFIPLKMSKTPPKIVEIFDKKTALHLSWEGSYLPANLIHKLMMRKFNELDTSCMWRNGARFVSRVGNSALVELDRSGLSVYVQGQHDRRVYMEDFRRHIQDIIQDLNLTCREMMHCTVNGKTGKIPYKDVLNQYRDGEKKIYISSIEDYADPQILLYEVHTKEHLLKEKANHIEINHSNISFADNGSIAVCGEKNTILLSDDDIKRFLQSIRSKNHIEQEQFDALLSHLKAFSDEKRLPSKQRIVMKKLLKQCKDRTASSTWGKLRGFLGDGANLTTIATFAIVYAPTFISLLKSIFSV